MNRMSDIRNTIIGRGDSYKYSHFKQYPKNIENNNSYIESRGVEPGNDMIPTDAEVVFFGLQAFIKQYLSTRITKEMVDRVEAMVTAHGEPFHREGWMKIVTKHDGYLPIEIFALPEGMPTIPGTAMVQVRATDPDFAWLASFVETTILRAVWYPSTVATVSRETKKIIKNYLDETADNEVIPDVLAFRLHDFGQRGVSSGESAAIGGLAHLINFMGTDTVESLWLAEEAYNANGPVGFSIPASEHSTITAWGKDNEVDAFENIIDEYGGEGKLYACVSDSFDIYDAVTNKWGGKLKDKVENNGGTLVVRPDSGDPVEVSVWVVMELARIFGTTVNSKGYKVLAPCVRVIQGDGVNPVTIRLILEKLKEKGFSAENIAFGMGGALLQKIDRDILHFAMKTNAVKINGEWKDVFKDPVGMEFKKSKAGILAVIEREGKLLTIREDELLPNEKSLLERVWKNGQLLVDWNFEEVRNKAVL